MNAVSIKRLIPEVSIIRYVCEYVSLISGGCAWTCKASQHSLVVEQSLRKRKVASSILAVGFLFSWGLSTPPTQATFYLISNA